MITGELKNKIDSLWDVFAAVWDNLIIQIGSVQLERGNTLDEQIAVDDQRAKIEKEIARLEKQARVEKQPKKKFELVQKIKELQAKTV